MKKRIIAAGLLATALTGQTVQAKTLEDVLKEKGVITEADYKEVTKVKPLDYKPGKGFTFTSPNEKFQLSLGGRLQARYSFLDRDQDSKNSAQKQDISESRVRRMKFWLSGYAYSKDLTYQVQTDFTQSSSSKFIDYAYLNYRVVDEFQVRAGQDKIPFGRQWLNPSGALQFVDRSPVSDAFRPGYDIGVMLHGKIANGLVNYNFGGYGGGGQGQVRSGNDNSFAARITVNPLGDMAYGEADLDRSDKPLLSIGANYYLNKLSATRSGTTTTLETNNLNFTQNSSTTFNGGGWLNNGANNRLNNRFTTSEKLSIDMYGVDAAFKWMGAYAVAEYLLAQAEGDKSGALLRSHGYYVQTGYCILPKKLETSIRYSWLDPDRDVKDDQISEVGGAVSWYFDKHNLKLQGDIANIHNQATGRSNEMQYRLQAQVIF